MISKSLTLSNRVSIPVIGLGTWQVQGDKVLNSVKWALEAGYRHIDTAIGYKNEHDIGKVIKESGISRKELFLTSKIPPTMQGYDSALQGFQKSIKDLQTDYLDLLLIHWPGVAKVKVNSEENLQKRKQTWLALEKLYKDGKVKSIGVSNYTKRHLEEMKTYATVMPMVNQVEFHPWLYDKDLLEYCKQSKIVFEAYSPLATGKLIESESKLLNEIAKKHNKSVAQVLIRWGLQHETVVLPRSTQKQHIIDNINVFDFELSKEDMQALNGMNKNYHVCWDPTDIK